jgi:CelD/BcsL family acetyltransferase involved in cellulose biosynthesis
MTAKALQHNEASSSIAAVRPASTGLTGTISVTVARSRSSLEAIAPAWEDLAAHAIEPNPLYEPWMLLASLKAMADTSDFYCLLVWSRDDTRTAAAARLDGLFPFRLVRRFKGLPAHALSSWHPASWMLGIPLVRAETAVASVQALLDWLDGCGKGAAITEFRYLPCDGAFRRVLADVLRERQATVVATESFARGVLRKRGEGKSTFEAAMSGESRRKLRRKERRLGERGVVTRVALQDDDDIDRWISELLYLDSMAWNCRQGVALEAREDDRRFAVAALHAAFRRGRLQMVGVDFDGWPIARRCVLTAGEGAYTFRSAYDPQFGYFSPGVMAASDCMRAFDKLPGVQWMDSIEHGAGGRINRLWKQRRTIQSLAVGSGAWGEMCASLIPVLGWAKKRVMPRKGLLMAAEAGLP